VEVSPNFLKGNESEVFFALNYVARRLLENELSFEEAKKIDFIINLVR
jgi:hypothetical protein